MSCAAPDPAAKAAPPAAQSPAHTPALDPASGRYLHGAAWSALNAVAGALLPLGIFVVFARWLPAAEIGAVTLGVAASEVIKAFGLPGFYEALLQQRDDQRQDDRQRSAETA